MKPDGWTTGSLAELLINEAPGFWGEPPGEEPRVAVLRSTNIRSNAKLELEDVAWRSFPARKLAEKALRPGDILLERSGGGPKQPVGRVAYFDADGVYSFSNFMQRLRPDISKCDGRFLTYELWRFHQSGGTEALQQATTGIRNLQYRDYLARKVDLPPIHEQRKIVAILSSVDLTLESTQAVIEQLGVVKREMVTELLSRGLPGRHSQFKAAKWGEVPASWNIRPCGDLFDVQLGKMMSAQARAGDNQLPYLRNDNVHWLRFNLSDVATMHFEKSEREKFRLRTGDLLACEGRHIGRGAVWRDEIDECYFQKALHRLRAKGDQITTEYMQFFMMLRFRYMTDLVAEANATSTIPHLPRERLVALPIWYPPRAEQDEIVSVLTAIVEKERASEEYLATLTDVKTVLMSLLLTGELRVLPDEVTP